MTPKPYSDTNSQAASSARGGLTEPTWRLHRRILYIKSHPADEIWKLNRPGLGAAYGYVMVSTSV